VVPAVRVAISPLAAVNTSCNAGPKRKIKRVGSPGKIHLM